AAAEVQHSPGQPLPDLRPPPRLHAAVPVVPRLLPEFGPPRRNSGRGQGELVRGWNRHGDDGSDRGYADTDSQRQHGVSRDGGRAGFQSEEGAGANSQGRGLHPRLPRHRRRQAGRDSAVPEVRRQSGTGDSGPQADQQARAPGVRRARPDPAGAGRPWDRRPVHVQRCYDRQAGPQAGRGRRSPLLRLVAAEEVAVVSRIGKQPIPLPAGVEVQVEGNVVRVKGAKGELTRVLPEAIQVAVEDGRIVVRRASDDPEHKALHGLSRTLVANMVEGVTKGYEKSLEIRGVGYRAQMVGNKLQLVV